MPLDFESKFTQPVLKAHENGTIKGGQGWADLISKCYADAVKTGFPVGVPPSLPAPGLGSPPPPFDIGASAFKTSTRRQKAMYQVLYAYAYAKELKAQNGQIDSLLMMLNNSLRHLRRKQQEIQQEIKDAEQMAESIKQLPQDFVEVANGIKTIVEQRIEQLKGLQNQIQKAKDDFNLSDADIKGFFGKEIELIDRVKNLKFNSLDSIKSAITEIPQILRDGERVQSILANPNAETFKKYLKQFITRSLREIFNAAKIIENPAAFIDFAKDLAKDSKDLEKFVKAILRISTVQRFIKPRLDKLIKKINEKKKKIEDKIKAKINDIRKKLQDAIEKKLKKFFQSKAYLMYKDAEKWIKDTKKDVEKNVKKVVKTTQKLLKLFDRIATVSARIVAFYETLKEEFKQIEKELERLRAQAEQRAKELVESANTFISSSQNSIQIVRQTATSETASSIASKYDAAGANRNLEGTLGQLQSAADRKPEQDDRAREQLQKSAEQRIKSELNNYLQTIGLSSLTDQVTGVITRSKSTVDDFKNLFTRKKKQYETYIKEFNAIDEEIMSIIKAVDELVKDDSKKETSLEAPKGEEDKKGTHSKVFMCLKDLFETVQNFLQPKIKRVAKWAKKIYDKVKNKVKKFYDKQVQRLESLQKMIFPRSSKTADNERKKGEEEAEALDKKRKAEERKALLALSVNIARAGLGVTRVALNISKGNYRYNDNRTSIEQVIDSIYAVRGYKQNDDVLKALNEEKKKAKEYSEYLSLIENIVIALVEFGKELQDTDFKKEWEAFYEQAIKNPTERQYTSTLEAINGFLKNPPKEPKEIIETCTNLYNQLANIQLVSPKLLELERKYLRQGRTAVGLLLKYKWKKGGKVESRLSSIRRELDKKQSYILLLIKFLKDTISDFFQFLVKVVKKQLQGLQDRLKKWRKKLEEKYAKQIKEVQDKLSNINDILLARVFGLATRVFWTGATWKGQTGSEHIVFNIGSFKRPQAAQRDGASNYYPDVARSFELQLKSMAGLVSPPPNTGIVPIPFNGYI